MILSDDELRNTLKFVNELHGRWHRVTRPADLRELSRHLAYSYRKLADHFRESACEPKPAIGPRV